MGLNTSNESYSSKIRSLEKRVSDLQEGVYLTQDQMSEPVLEELKASLEELNALNEGLEQQNRELLAAQSALEEERQRYQELFDQASDGYLVTDLVGNIQQANRTLSRQLGLSPALLRGKPLPAFISPQDRRDFTLHLDHLGQRHQSSEFETSIQPRVGEPFPARVTVSPVKDSRGQITGLRWLVHEITERKREEQERAQQVEEISSYQAAFHELSDGIKDFAIFLLDPSGNIVTWNRGAQEIKGYQAGEIIGRHFSCFYPEEDIRGGKPQRLLEIAATEGSVEDEGWRVRQGGEKFWASVLITAFRSSGGAVQGFAKVVRDLTERKHAEETLAFQGEIIRNLAEGVVVLRNSDGVIVYANSRFAEMFGYGPAELIGQHISCINAPGDKSPEEVADEILADVRKEGFWAGEVRNIKKDGTLFWCHASASAFEHPEYGRLWISVHTDITQRKAAEAALRESETRFRSLVQSATAAIIIGDGEGRIVSWNRGARDTFGYTEAEALGQDSALFVPERYKAGRQRALVLAARTGEGNLPTRPLEFQARRKDGSEFPAELSLVSWRTESGLFFGAIIRDVTERKQAEEDRIRLRGLALQEEEWRRLQTLIDTSPVGVIVVDAHTQRLVLVNREAQRLRGDSYQPGRKLEECSHSIIYRRPDGQEWDVPDLPIWRALMYGETVQAEEVVNEFPDGHAFPTLVNASPVYSTDGRIVSAICIIQDLTPRQDLEKLRNEFLGMVAHELRTPLSTIKGAAATGLRSRVSPRSNEGQELFQIIEDQVDEVTDLVSDLLDLTRIEAGVFTVSAEPTNMDTILEEAIAGFGRIHPSSWVDLQVPLEPPTVQADQRRIVQVLTNLLDNAARFSPPDSPVTLGLEHQGSFVTVYVRDRGTGIPQEKLPYLFKKFSRFDGDHFGAAPGAGLGLAICQGIVEAHGEHIWADSGPDGAGTTISFTLPVATEATASSPQDTPAGGVIFTGNGAPAEGLRILAVDDDQNALRFLRRLLEGAGYVPILAHEPEQVLGAVQLKAPDLVLLDLILPGSDGLDVMRSIREHSDVPVIFLTARNTRDDMVNALKMGADDYITKPFSESELLARIEAVLRRKPLAGNIEKTAPYQFDGLAIDFNQRRVTVEGREVSLSATEYKLLSELAKHGGRVLTHDQILQMVWGRDYSGETDLLRSTVRRLRHKLGDNAQSPRYIFTVSQVGYRMSLSPVYQPVSV